MSAKPKTETAPRLTRHELGRYIVADLIDHLAEAECNLRALKKQAENALAALNTENKDNNQ